MKRIGVDLSPKQHSRIRNGHFVRVKKGSGILLVNAGNYDALSKTFLRGKSKDISLTAEEIMANRKISPEAHNEARGGQMGSYSMSGATPQQQDADRQAYIDKHSGGGFFQTKQDRQEGREQQKYGKFAGGSMTPEERQQASADWRAEQTLAQEQREIQYEQERRQAEKEHKQDKREANAGPFAFLVGGGFQNNIGGTKVRTMAGLTSGYLYDAGQGNLDANIGNMMLNLKSVKSRQGNGITGCGMVETRPHTQVPTVMGRGSMLVGRPQALQSQPLSANYQFRNMFPPAFKKHME